MKKLIILFLILVPVTVSAVNITGRVHTPGHVIPEVSITSIASVKEGESARFDVEFEFVPAAPVDVTLILGDNKDTATPGVDYDGSRVYSANGTVLAIVDVNNRFTLPQLPGNTEFYVQTRQEFQNNEETEILTVVLERVSNGAVPTATIGGLVATVSIEDVLVPEESVPEVSITSIANVKEGESARFSVEFDFVPAAPVDVTLILGGRNDTATPGEDYDGSRVYSANGTVLAIVDVNNRFTLPQLPGNTEFYVQTRQEFQNNEETEILTVVLERVSNGAVPTATIGGLVATVSIEDVLVPEESVPEVSITSIANVKEGESARFSVEFDFVPAAPVDVTLILGGRNDTATPGEDYDGSRVYSANGTVLAIVDVSNRFTLPQLPGNTEFYVQTRQEFQNNEGTEILTVVLESVGDGAVPTATLGGLVATVSIEDVLVPEESVPEVSITSEEDIEDIKEGALARVDVEFDFVPASPVDVTLILGGRNDTATPGEDYDGSRVYDANGTVLAIVDVNNRFTLPQLPGNTEFYVQTHQEFQNSEGIESLTVILESVSDGAVPPATLGGHLARIFIEEVSVSEISIINISNARGKEGVPAEFVVGFTSDLRPESDSLDITIVLGESDDTAIPGVDYDGSQVYDENGAVLAIVDENNLFTLENVAEPTRLFIRTFTDKESDEEDEFFTASLVSYIDGSSLISLVPPERAQAIIKNEPLSFFISSQANDDEGFLAQFAVGTTQTSGTLFDVTITLGAQGDNATPGVDYDIAQVYDANGAVLATVDQNNRFTLKDVQGATNFYVKTFTDQESNEEDEFFTATLDEVTVGGVLMTPDLVLNAQAIIISNDLSNDPLEIFISSQSSGKEGYSAEFNITFNVLPQSAVDVTIMLGEQDDTATLGIDYERSRVYAANRVPLATVNGDTFTLTGLTGNTRFYVQTFREAPFLDDSVDHEGTESITATLVSYKVGGNTIIPDTERSAKADIEELQPTDLITVSSNLDVYIPNMVQISENVDRFFMVTLKHAGGNIWVETARVPKAHEPNTIYYSTSPPDQDIDIFSGIYMGVPDGIEIFARLAFRGFNADGKMHWELTAAGEI